MGFCLDMIKIPLKAKLQVVEKGYLLHVALFLHLKGL